MRMASVFRVPASDTTAERQVSLTFPKRPCPNGTDNPSPLTLNHGPAYLPNAQPFAVAQIERLFRNKGFFFVD